MAIIRPEEPGDAETVYAVHAAAFPTEAEAKLVDAIRETASPSVSLVALIDDRVVGHVFFSPVTVGPPGAQSKAIALGPLAVAPALQRSGVGSELCRAGLEACAELGEPVVFVLGHVDYYPRFGFRPAGDRGLYFGAPGPNPAFMLAELRDGALGELTGEVRYMPEFYALG